VPIIRRNNFIYATLGICHFVWMTVWYTGWKKNYDNTVHLYSQAEFRLVSMAATTIIREDNTTDQTTALYFASPLNTELFMSHLPRMVCGVVCPYDGGGHH
jgi:hypothetical protein